MNREEIKQFLPHREPMLLADDMEMQENGEVLAHYTVKGDEFFLQGHFPEMPVVPGVILCEIMGQCCSLLVKEHLQGRLPLYAGLDNIRFKHSVHPGDRIEVRGHIAKSRGLVFFVESKASVNGQICAQGNLSFALVDKPDKTSTQPSIPK